MEQDLEKPQGTESLKRLLSSCRAEGTHMQHLSGWGWKWQQQCCCCDLVALWHDFLLTSLSVKGVWHLTSLVARKVQNFQQCESGFLSYSVYGPFLNTFLSQNWCTFCCFGIYFLRCHRAVYLKEFHWVMWRSDCKLEGLFIGTGRNYTWVLQSSLI